MASMTRDEFHRELERADPDRPCFAGRDLAGIDLASHWLGPIDFTGADLRGADLHESRLHGADLSGADLRDTNLRGASLRHVFIKRAELAGADLRDADLSHAMLAQTDLTTARLRGAWLDSVELSGTELPERWQSITRIHRVPDDPFARHDVVAAVRRDLADDDRPAALQTLRGALQVSASNAEFALTRLLARGIDSLAGLRGDDLPPTLDAAIAARTTAPGREETATRLAALADADLVTCRRHGLRWIMEQALRRRRVMDAFMLLRHLGLTMSTAKGLMDQASRKIELVPEVCAQVDDGELGAGADRLASELWGLEYDTAVRTLWGLRDGLRGE
jgi:hypothetical protein